MNTSATMRMKIIVGVLMLAHTTMVDAPPQGTSTCTCTNPDLCFMDNNRCQCCKTGQIGSDCGEKCPSCRWNYNTCSLSCSPGKWGDKCQKDCPQNCIQSSNKSVCNISTGGCNGCPQGYHGKTCDKQCRHTCENNLCHQGNGTCKSCAGGTYGDYCENKCSHGCYSDTCSNNGSCDCKSGWKGKKCLEECANVCKEEECIVINASTTCKGGYKDQDSTWSFAWMLFTVVIGFLLTVLIYFVMLGLSLLILFKSTRVQEVFSRFFRPKTAEAAPHGDKSDVASHNNNETIPLVKTEGSAISVQPEERDHWKGSIIDLHGTRTFQEESFQMT